MGELHILMVLMVLHLSLVFFWFFAVLVFLLFLVFHLQWGPFFVPFFWSLVFHLFFTGNTVIPW